MKKFVAISIFVLVLIGAFFVYQNQSRKAMAERATSEWEQIRQDTSATRFDSFITQFPQSEFAPLAQQKRDSLRMESDWRTAAAAHTLESFLHFQQTWPASPYSAKLDADIASLRLESAWRNALKKNTIPAYKEFVSKHPKSERAALAKKKIIDLEVDKIFAGKHGVLPPPQKTSPGSSQSNRISIEIQTDYTLTVRYSGPQSMKAVLNAHAKNSFTLPSGTFRVAASVDHPNVIPFAGSQNLSGGEYSSVYYISGL